INPSAARYANLLAEFGITNRRDDFILSIPTLGIDEAMPLLAAAAIWRAMWCFALCFRRRVSLCFGLCHIACGDQTHQSSAQCERNQFLAHWPPQIARRRNRLNAEACAKTNEHYPGNFCGEMAKMIVFKNLVRYGAPIY